MSLNALLGNMNRSLEMLDKVATTVKTSGGEINEEVRKSIVKYLEEKIIF